MPTYPYQCEACGNEFEIEQRITDEPLKHCENCGTRFGLKRLISNTSFVLRGNGWANDLYSSPKVSKKP